MSTATKKLYRARIIPLFDGHRQEDKAFWEYTHAGSENQATYFLMIRYPFPKFFVEKPVLDTRGEEEAVLAATTPTGTCYMDAGRYQLEHPDATLVHGSIVVISEGETKRILHAWVELPDGSIWSNGLTLTKEQWTITQAEEHARYDLTQASVQMIKQKHWGPWIEHRATEPEGLAIAVQLGLRYDGVQEGFGDIPTAYMFTDILQTGSSFPAETLSEAKDSLAAMRKRFAHTTPNTNLVRRTNPGLDAMVRHLGYEPVDDNSITRTDIDIVRESQERLKEVEIIPDRSLSPAAKTSLSLAKRIADDVASRRRVRGVRAASIPPASDRVRTAGMYSRGGEEIYISADMLARGKTAVDSTLHEMAHHNSGAEDGNMAHSTELSRLGGLVVEKVASRKYDDIIGSPDFRW